jgi:large subunit ribosomal protein L35Ae
MFKSKLRPPLSATKVNTLSQPVIGRIVNYRIGIRTQASHECLIQFTHLTSASQAGQLIGQKVVWKGEKKSFNGIILGAHGKNGALRARFKKGVPGQALGTTVELVSKKP